MMTLDTGTLWLCTVANTAEPGEMPREQATRTTEHFFGDRTIGYGRQYAAKGVNEQVDRLVRIWWEPGARIGMVAEIDGEQYRIDNVQHLLDDDGLQVTDLTLRRLDTLYDITDKT